MASTVRRKVRLVIVVGSRNSPMEIDALAAPFHQDRSRRPIWILLSGAFVTSCQVPIVTYEGGCTFQSLDYAPEKTHRNVTGARHGGLVQ